MPSDHINCPLCQREVARNNLGGHFLSSAHKDDLISRNHSALCQQYQRYVEDKKPLYDMNLFPLRVKNDTYHMCFGCKRCYMADNLHLSTSKGCKEKHLKGIAALLGKRTAEEPANNSEELKEAEKRIRELEAKMAALEAEKDKEVAAMEDREEKALDDAITLINLVERLSGIEPQEKEDYGSYADRIKDVISAKEGFFKTLLEQTKGAPLPPAAPEPPPRPPAFNATAYQAAPQQAAAPLGGIPILPSTKRTYKILPKQVGAPAS